MLKITHEDFSVDEIVQKIKSKEIGAIVSFIGIVRGKSNGKNVDKLEVQAREEMAIRELGKIRAETFQKFKVKQLAIVKRVGSLKASENLLLIVVGASHRDEAFKACRHVLERIKKMEQIWEKEIYTCEKQMD
jgi:molybdopterin synthase catalytic subunit